MNEKIDDFDRQILNVLQRDGSLAVEAVAEKVHLSRNATWRRIKRLEADGILMGRYGRVNAEKVGRGLSVFVFLRTANHDAAWLETFRNAVTAIPEITGAYRTSGDLDYVLQAKVADVKHYDQLYQRLIKAVPLHDVSACFVMEDVKDMPMIPL